MTMANLIKVGYSSIQWPLLSSTKHVGFARMISTGMMARNATAAAHQQQSSENIEQTSQEQLQAKSSILTHVASTANNPVSHNMEHVRHFYTVSKPDLDAILEKALPRRMTRFSKLVGSTDILIREPAIDIINSIRNRSIDQQPPRFIISGKDGVGKTVTLAHVIHYCYRSNWFILHVPSVYKWISPYPEIKKSHRRKNYWDQIEHACEWLTLCKTINRHLIENMTVTKTFHYGRGDKFVEGDSFAKVIEQGLLKSEFAVDVIECMINEVATQTKIPVLYAVDEYNGLFGKSAVQDWEKNYIDPARLSLVRHFIDVLRPHYRLRNGAYVMAVSRTGVPRSECFSTKKLLPGLGIRRSQPFQSSVISNLTKEEVQLFIRYYKMKSWLNCEDETEVNEIYNLTSGNALLLNKISAWN